MSGIMKSLRTGADRAAFETARLVRIQREQFKLKAQEDQKRELLLNLGEAVWQMYRNNKVSDLRLVSVCQTIQATIQRIQALEKTIEQIKQEQPPEPPQCPHCGEEVSSANAFCPACGTKIPEASSPPVVATPTGQVCPQCGHVLRPGATFCSGCGHRFVAP